MNELKCTKSLTGEGLVRLEYGGQLAIREADCWALYFHTHTGIPLFQRRTNAQETAELDLILDLILEHHWYEDAAT